MANISSWTTSADFNNSAAPDGFPEGMAPSGVNDAAREVMAAVRRYVEDAQFFNWGHTPVQQSSKAFLVSTTATQVYTPGRRIKLLDGGVTILASVEASAPSGSNTVVSITSSSAITSSLTSLSVALLNPVEKSSFDLWRLATLVKSATYTMSAGDIGKAIEIDGNTTLKLPAVPADFATTNVIVVSKTDTGANAVSITAAAGDTINGFNNEYLIRQHDHLILRASQATSKWQIMAGRKTYESSEITISGAAVYSASHAGHRVPFWFGAFLRNTSGELCYSAGDEIAFGGTDTDATGAYDVVVANSTNFYLLHTRAAWAIARRDTGAATNLPPVSWRLVVKARWEF